MLMRQPVLAVPVGKDTNKFQTLQIFSSYLSLFFPLTLLMIFVLGFVVCILTDGIPVSCSNMSQIKEPISNQ